MNIVLFQEAIYERACTSLVLKRVMKICGSLLIFNVNPWPVLKEIPSRSFVPMYH